MAVENHSLDSQGLDLNALMDGIGDTEPPLGVTIRPLADALDQWKQLSEATGNATLFHRPGWAEVLRRAYGFRVFVATLERHGKVLAGCLLSRTKNPFAHHVVGLPFSDSCSPLGVDDDATAALMRGLAAEPRLGGNLEIRGIKAPAPWQTVDNFEQWSLDLARPFAVVQREADRNFRRQVKRAASEAFRIDTGDSAAMLRRFYAIQLETRRRLGVPPQPLRFFCSCARSSPSPTASRSGWPRAPGATRPQSSCCATGPRFMPSGRRAPSRVPPAPHTFCSSASWNITRTSRRRSILAAPTRATRDSRASRPRWEPRRRRSHTAIFLARRAVQAPRIPIAPRVRLCESGAGCRCR